MQATTVRVSREKSNVDPLLGQPADKSHYDRLYKQSIRIEREDGSLVCALYKNAMPLSPGGSMYRILSARTGVPIAAPPSRADIMLHGIGYAEPTATGSGRDAYAPTEFGKLYPKALLHSRKAILHAQALLDRSVPAEALEAQRARAAAVGDSGIIEGTTFSTISVHRNKPRPIARDTATFPGALSVLSLYRGGRYRGGDIVFPAYRIALAFESLDMLVYDASEAYGELALEGQSEGWERITCLHALRVKA